MAEEREAWRPVHGFEGIYSVSNRGSVRRDLQSPGATAGRILRNGVQKSGHQHVTLSYRGVARIYLVHRLVLEAFVRPAAPWEEGRHLNGDPSDNRLENLAWGSSSDNKKDSVLHRTHHNSAKTHCGNGHPLEEPNLKRVPLTRAHRSCLACGRENSLAWNQKRHFSLERANRNYERIMKGVQ